MMPFCAQQESTLKRGNVSVCVCVCVCVLYVWGIVGVYGYISIFVSITMRNKADTHVNIVYDAGFLCLTIEKIYIKTINISKS